MQNNQTMQEIIKRLTLTEYHIENLHTFEFSNNLDSYSAYQKSVSYLNSRMGVRWIGGGMDSNSAINAVVPTLTINGANSASPIWYTDSTLGFSYINLSPTYTQYLSNNYTPSGIWGPDSAIYNWGSSPGVTAGAWVKISSHTGTNQGVISAWDATTATAQASWRIQTNTASSDKAQCTFSNTGAFVTGAEVFSNNALPTGRWIFIATRWTPSTAYEVFVWDGDELDYNTNTTAVLSDLHDAKWFFIGSYRNSAGTNFTFNGDVGLSFFHVSSFTDAELYYLHQISRSIYGV